MEKKESVELTHHEWILIGNALQAYCMYLYDSMNNFAPTDGAKKYLAKCLEDAEKLQDKFTEW